MDLPKALGRSSWRLQFPAFALVARFLDVLETREAELSDRVLFGTRHRPNLESAPTALAVVREARDSEVPEGARLGGCHRMNFESEPGAFGSWRSKAQEFTSSWLAQSVADTSLSGGLNRGHKQHLSWILGPRSLSQ